MTKKSNMGIARTLACVFAGLSLAVMACSLAGCAGPQIGPLTSHEIDTHGTLEMNAPRDAVFGACVLALRMEGYVIDVADPVTGIVVTMFKGQTRSASEPAPGWRSRGYVVLVKDLPAGKVRVVANPSPGEALPSVPAEPTWDLDHERANWSRLFDDVRMLVARQAGENN